eukprot:TRINITY_DN9063_c0_g1_i1.p1 TRINITY_DN9063_c0_g1~~TRINITY_DN9063_c0_g1_i1.p1  ORF type:complete len:825 (+),score=172.23 TRINITY_DN9063_c0_g1_i1:25-2499(+)
METAAEETVQERKNLTYAVVFVSFLIFALTVCPSVPPGDSGEMISSAYTLGVAHPPGYPLICIIGKVFATFIPFNTIAWRINLLSAVCVALASGIMFMLVERLTNSHSAALFSSVMLSFTPLIWTYALVAEVFSLNNLLVMCLLYCTTLFYLTEDVKYANYGALVMGLGLANQHTIVFFIIPLFPFILYFGRRVLFRGFTLVRVLLWGLAGLSPYIYLPIAALRRTANSWGDHRTLRGMLKHFLREEYGTFQLASNHNHQHQWLDRIQLLLWNFVLETLYYGAIICAIGVIVMLCRRRLRLLGVAFVFTFTFYTLMFNTLANLDVYDPLLLGVQARFWQQLYLMLCIWCGFGWQWIVDVAVPRLLAGRVALETSGDAGSSEFLDPVPTYDSATAPANKSDSDDDAQPATVTQSTQTSVSPRRRKTSPRTLSQTRVVIGIVVVLAAIQIGTWYGIVDQSDNWVTEEFCKAILEPLPENAFAILKSDHIEFPVRYLQTVADFRPDIGCANIDLIPYRWSRRNIGPLMPHVVFPGTHYSTWEPEGYNLKELIDANLPRHRMFLCGVLPTWDESWHGHYIMWSMGLTGEFLRNNDLVPLTFFEDNYRAVKSLMRVPVVHKGYGHIYHCWEYLVWRNFQESVDININFFSQLIEQQPHLVPRVGKNLAVLYQMLLPFDRRASTLQKRNDAARAFLNWEDSRNDPARAEIQQILDSPPPAEVPAVMAKYRARGRTPPAITQFRAENDTALIKVNYLVTPNWEQQPHEEPQSDIVQTESHIRKMQQSDNLFVFVSGVVLGALGMGTMVLASGIVPMSVLAPILNSKKKRSD